MPEDEPQNNTGEKAAQPPSPAASAPAEASLALEPVMTVPNRYLGRMIFFLAVVLVLGAALQEPLYRAFLANPFLNGVIGGVLVIGIAYVFRQVTMLGAEVHWIEEFRKSENLPEGTPPLNVERQPKLLAPMATMMRERHGLLTLSAISLRSVLDTIGSRLDESREISRYLIGLLIFLGLLGTFWGLLATVSAVGETIRSLSVASGDFANMFDDLKSGLEKPLSGMGTAFSSSLFGLGGSLVLGFLDLQASQAQNRFYNDLEEWLSTRTRLSTGLGDGDQSAPAYVTALLEQTAESLDNLQRIFLRSEESRSATSNSLMSVAQRLSSLTDQMTAEQELVLKLTSEYSETKPVLERLARALDALATAQGAAGLDDASRTHLSNIDVQLSRLVEQTASGQDRLIDELRAELKLLTRTLAGLVEGSRKAGP